MLNFDPEKHLYTLDGKPLISVTQLLRKHGLAPDFSGIDEEVLARKAERGTMIHKEIEEYVKSAVVGFTDELQQFIDLTEKSGIEWCNSEKMVNNDLVAGTIDLEGFIGSQMVIADIKTGVKIEYDTVRWQLALYAYLAGHSISSTRFYIFHLGTKPEMVEITPASEEEVKALLECERKGEIYRPLPAISLDLLMQVETIENIISERKARLAEAEADEAELKAALIKAMKETGTKSFDGGSVKITYVPAGERKSVDTKRLKEKYPDVAKECEKTSPVAETVRITYRESKIADD